MGARELGLEIADVAERRVMRLLPDGVTVTDSAPSVDLERDVLARAEFPLQVAPDLRAMLAALFHPARFGLRLEE